MHPLVIPAISALAVIAGAARITTRGSRATGKLYLAVETGQGWRIDSAHDHEDNALEAIDDILDGNPGARTIVLDTAELVAFANLDPGNKAHWRNQVATGSRARRSPNRKAYVAWTCVDTATGWRIESGWEYREDALDRKKDMIDGEGWDTSRVKVMQRAGLQRLGLDPARREDWLSY